MLNFIKLVLLIFLGLLILLGIYGGLIDFVELFSINISSLAIVTTAFIVAVVYLGLVNAELKWSLSRKRAMQKRIDGLARLRKIAVTELFAMTPTVAEFPKWKEDYATWEESLMRYLEEKFPFAVIEMFQDLGMIPPNQFTNASKNSKISASHQHHLRMLAKYLTIMERLIHENTSLVPEETPSFKQLLEWLPGD